MYLSFIWKRRKKLHVLNHSGRSCVNHDLIVNIAAVVALRFAVAELTHFYLAFFFIILLLPKIIAFNPFLCRVLRVPVPPMLLPPMYWWYKNKPSFCPYHMLIFRIFDALKEYKKLRYSWLRNHFNPFFLFITIRSCQLKNLLLPRGMAVSNYEKRIQVWDQRNQFQCQLFYKMLQKLIRR